MSTVYLARPIDHIDPVKTEHYQQLVREITRQNRGVLFYLPHEAFSLTKQTQPSTVINTINNTALAHSDLLLVLWLRDSKSWGVPAEVTQAIQQNKRILLATNMSRQQLGWAAQYTPSQVTYMCIDTRRSFGTIGNEIMAQIGLQLGDPRDQGGGTMTLPVAVGETGKQPTRAHQDDAGLDLYVSKTVVVPPTGFYDIPSDTRVQLPLGVWGYLTGRSSTLRKKGLLVNPGVIDTGYTGELFSGVWNLTNEPVIVHQGERIAQLILIRNETENYTPVQVAQLDVNTTRGQNGFGSSGN